MPKHAFPYLHPVSPRDYPRAGLPLERLYLRAYARMTFLGSNEFYLKFFSFHTIKHKKATKKLGFTKNDTHHQSLSSLPKSD